MEINFRIPLCYLISFNGSTKILQWFIFANISAPKCHENKLLAKLNRFTALCKVELTFPVDAYLPDTSYSVLLL